jgi:FemAB-related protein (PEP-CTERM system-associated)
MNASPVQARLFSGSAQQWDGFIGQQPAATSSHLFAWKRVVEGVYKHDCPYLAAYQGDTLVGVLPLVDVRSLAFGRFVVSMPFLNAGGPLGSEKAVSILTTAAVELARERRARVLELRCTTSHDLELEHSTEKVASVLPLASAPESLWAALPGKLRSQIRRPTKEGVKMRFGLDQIEAFFGVFARNMRDLGSPTHPLDFFRAIACELETHTWFGCAYYRGRPVAAGCAIQWGEELEMLWASSLREHNTIAPNMLLYWSFIERAAALGIARFNFGRSTPGSGPHRFKLQWGAQDVPLHWYRATLRAGATTPKKENGSLSLATRLWQRVPVPLATMVGSRLRGGIPS